jgi:hypothetical protein
LRDAKGTCMTQRPKLGLYGNDKWKSCESTGKRWPDFQLFAKRYWKLLSKYTLVVSETTAASLSKVASELMLEGIDPQWHLDSYSNRGFIARLTATHREEIERVLLFLDSQNLEEEIESLWILRQAIAEHGQKLNINYRGACQWAESEVNAVENLQSKSLIGANDGIVLVGQKPGLAIDRFAIKHLERVALFPRLVLPSLTRAAIGRLLSAAEIQVNIPEHTSTTEDIMSFLVANYFRAGFARANEDVCHVIVCPGRYRERKEEGMEALIQVCTDPHMKVNLMLNKETAEEWILRQRPFEIQHRSSSIQ